MVKKQVKIKLFLRSSLASCTELIGHISAILTNSTFVPKLYCLKHIYVAIKPRQILLHQQWQARFLCGNSDYFGTVWFVVVLFLLRVDTRVSFVQNFSRISRQTSFVFREKMRLASQNFVFAKLAFACGRQFSMFRISRNRTLAYETKRDCNVKTQKTQLP